MTYEITFTKNENQLAKIRKAATYLEKAPDALANQMLVRMTRAVNMARMRCAVFSGELRDSIEILSYNQNPDEPTVSGGTLLPRSGYIEFGTRYMHARPYWRPTVWENWFGLRQDIEDYLRRIKQ